MKIKEILKYDWNYAEYIVTDDKHDLICMCISVPLPNNMKPQVGMEISMIYAFSNNDVKITKVMGQNKYIIERGSRFFNYCIQGKIIDVKKAIVQVFDFKISLENQFPSGLQFYYSNGDFITINVDRLDCCIDI